MLKTKSTRSYKQVKKTDMSESVSVVQQADSNVSIVYLDSIPAYFCKVKNNNVSIQAKIDLIDVYDKSNPEIKSKSVELLKMIFQKKKIEDDRLSIKLPHTNSTMQLKNVVIEKYNCDIPIDEESEPISFEMSCSCASKIY